MELAYAAGRAGGTMPAVMNAANEEAVAQFLEERIHFLDIPEVIEAACERHKPDLMAHPQLDDVLEVDQWARTAVREQVSRGTTRIPGPAIAA
jgi:1-deoxy-D-xylulose-5-phosphate reductoisomerase